MVHSLTPAYLTTLIPSRICDTTSYSLRNSINLRNILCRTQLLSNSSFLSSTMSAWNTLPEDKRSSPSVPAFKHNLKKNKTIYYDCDHSLSVIHARLRMQCSNTNEHLFSNNIVISPNCHCGDIFLLLLHTLYPNTIHLIYTVFTIPLSTYK